MFTGIITDIGTIESIEKNGGIRATISTAYDISNIDIGASIACSGVCLTVVDTSTALGKKGIFTVDISQETISCTNIANWKAGTKINLERALRLGDEFGGHIVSGHVDALAFVKNISKIAESHSIEFMVPDKFARYIAEKGSVTLDGVALTVNQVGGNSFKVNIIPHTFTNTTFSDLSVGRKVNLEIDMLARYISRVLEYKQ